MAYDFTEFLLADKKTVSKETVAKVAKALADVLNAFIVVGIEQPGMFKGSEPKFGNAQIEMWKLACELAE